ncbi:MAG: hypothetical protein AVDCRST_MAG68-1194 [uncultured Gemmatimonadetes bacterium]|uniref:FHA domain-containing protein n=1 Tax=uncultured Gemmatimonadota bacterium TaxID=203437 RepID=A0A6J4KSZ2_9BACT|nr:MAG: hypothetical protein AVDCRST_MAG68-1194 [uncultured Gemmatimonadota bacterium]
MTLPLMDVIARILRRMEEPGDPPHADAPAPVAQDEARGLPAQEPSTPRTRSSCGRCSDTNRPLLLALLVLLLPAPAEAQFPFPWRRKPPALAQPQWPSAPPAAVATPMQPASTAPWSPAAQPVVPGGLAPGQPELTPAQSQGPVEKQGLTTLQQEDRARLLKMAREASLTPAATVRDAEDRMERWKMVMLIDPADVEARLGFEQAQKELDAARAREEAARAARETLDRELSAKRDRLRLAERALYARDLDGAAGILGDVLRQHPDDPRAGSLMQMLRDARRAQETRRRLMYGAAGLLAGALLLGAWARRADHGRKQETPPAADPPRALIRIVDGVGRGKLVPITRDILRIGAADDVENGDLNDLVVSDAGAAVSRYHCAIVRKGRDYLLLDSSLNGTRLNGRRLSRGEHQVLRHGDEFVLAGSSRLKFLRT